MTHDRPDSILYELFIYAEWRPDPDFIRGEIGYGESSKQSAVNYLLGFIKSEETLVECIQNYIDQLQPWQICLGDDGKVVAVLQDTVLEIRSKRGNYSTVVARVGVPRDTYPQWRKMVWSPDCSMLAIAHSNGKVSFYDLMATNLFDIPPDCSQPLDSQCTDTTHSVAGIVFLKSRVIEYKWSSEVLLVDYRGGLRSFFVSPTDGFKFNHKFNFEGGVSTVSYHNSHNIIFVTGLTSPVQKETFSAHNYGIRAWRLLNDAPFYKLSITSNDLSPTSWKKWFDSVSSVPFRKKNHKSVITKAVPSPNGSMLACLHLDGSISLWHLPVLRFSKIWPLSQQPRIDVPTPFASNDKLKVWPALKNGLSDCSPLDVNWWNDEAVIVSRLNGSVTICSVSDLHNMLGDNPEFLQGHPQIISTFDNGFLSLECEAALKSAKKLTKDDDNNDDASNREISETDGANESSDDEKRSLMGKLKDAVTTTSYIITDMERFQPKLKKLYLLSRVYRLLCLKSTTPEDLYSRKIENGDYTEALILAQKYDLDCDLVYQQQWRSSKVSHQSITDYLSKVSKKKWIIQQCCDRVPESLSAAKELLEFGLHLSNKDISKGESFESGNHSKNRDAYLKSLTMESLSTNQSEVLRFRHTMLFYLDRLQIYRTIIDVEQSAYSIDEYNRLRCCTICRNAVEFARQGRIRAIECLWPHLNELPLHLFVLQNIPETVDPAAYRNLLPEYTTRSNLGVEIHTRTRKKDWCENEIFSSIWSASWSEDIQVDGTVDNAEYDLPSPNLTDWYSKRARMMDRLSGLPDHALSLITLAREKNVPGMEELYSSLLTLDTLVYEVGVENMNLTRLDCCSQFQVSNYLMSKSSLATVVEDLKRILFPYLERCEKLSINDTSLKDMLLNEFIVNLGNDDLNFPLMILHGADELNLNVDQCLRIVNNCLMSQKSQDQLELCFEILDALSTNSDGSVAPSYLVASLDEMKRLLNACSMIEMHGVRVTFAELKSIIKKPTKVKPLLTSMASCASDKNQSRKSDDWNDLLSDMLDLQAKVFSCIDIELIYEIFAVSLLSSANKSNILAAKSVLTCHSNEKPGASADQWPPKLTKVKSSQKIVAFQKVPYERSVTLIIEAAIEYFNYASSITDSILEHSWECLQLIREDNSSIKKEKDLILSLRILAEFEMSIFPIEVRLNTNKIGLIEDCLNYNDRAYKSVEKLLQLAKLLQISEEDDKKREVAIVSLCAEKALEIDDIEETKKLCKRLVKSSEGPAAAAGVKAAHRLGADQRLNDHLLRRDLLNIALMHCDAANIESILQIRSSVEAEMLQTEISNLVNITKLNARHNIQDSIESTDDDYVDALTSPTGENKILTAVQYIEDCIQKPIQVLNDKRSLWMENHNTPMSKDSVPETKHKFLSDYKISCHTFYKVLFDDCHISSFATHYDKFSTPEGSEKQLVLLQALIRNNLLQECIHFGNSDTSSPEALAQCAEYLMSEDTALSISHFMSVYDISVSNNYLFNIPLDARSVCCFLYYYALVNYIEMHRSPDEAFFQVPSKLVHDVIKEIESLPPEEVKYAKQEMLNCRDRFLELVEGERLNHLGCDVDIGLFSSDPSYRKEAIIKLSRTSSADNYNLAKDLAKKYEIDEREIAVNHLSYVILQHKVIGVAECTKLISDADSIAKLNLDAASSIQGLHDNIWMALDGKDHRGIILYFNLIDSLNNRHLFNGINAKEHLKLVKKVKCACSSLDYKLLINLPSQEDLVAHILPSLTKENISLTAKLLRNVPPSISINFNTSNMYRLWLSKFFFDLGDHTPSSKKWMQQYRECSGYFSKLKKEDIFYLMEDILFSDAGLQKVPSTTRIQIALQTEEYCEHEHSNNCNGTTKNSVAYEDPNWKDVGDEIGRWGKFLENFHSENVVYLVEGFLGLPSDFWRNFEQTRGNKNEMLKSLKILMCENHLPLKKIKSFLNYINDSITIDDVLTYTLKDIKFEARSVLSPITGRLMEYKLEKMSIDQGVLDKLKPYLTSAFLSSKQRLELMSLYKADTDNANVEMLSNISMEIITNTWDKEITETIKELDFLNELNRSNIFINLLEHSDSWERLKSMVDLINMWPLPSCADQDESPHLCLIIKILKDEKNIKDNIPLLKLLMEKHSISEDEISWIISVLKSDNSVGQIWLCMLSPHESVQRKELPTILNEVKEIEKLNDHMDNSLICLILDKGLFTYLVKTPIYPRLVKFLLKDGPSDDASARCAYTVDMAIDDLLRKGFVAEAGSLKLAIMGIPNALRGFSQAINFHKRQ